jgi:hypothetical protein
MTAVLDRELKGMMKYRHTQIGWVSMAALGIGLLLMLTVFGGMTRLQIPMAAFVVLIAVFSLCLLVFCALTTEVDGEEFRARFGVLGWPGKRVELGEIAAAVPVRLSWPTGWGIRITTRGWLFNVSGRGAVIVGLNNGKQFLVGSDEPARLADAINRSLGREPVFAFIRGAGIVAQ